MAKNTTIEALVSLMVTGLTSPADNLAWLAYCESEAGAFAPSEKELKGIKVSGKEAKGTIAFKGADTKVKGTRLNRALVALHIATAVHDLIESTGFEGVKADVSELCAAWKARRDEKLAPKTESQNA